MKRISQNKLELAVAIGFSVVIFALSSTKIGYVPISGSYELDMGIIPAIFAAMIGGYRVGIPVAILWSTIAYYNPASHLQFYGLFGIMISRIVLVTIAYHAYKVCKRYYEGSPMNVYRGIVAAVTAKNIVSSIILMFVLHYDGVFKIDSWLKYTAEQYLLELALCSLAMAFLIKHLRQVHILNGIKRREKAKAKAMATQEL